MKIIFVAAEADPFVKTGGLGEVVSSLPGFLQKQGVEVRVIIPKYGQIPEHFRSMCKPLARFEVPVGWRRQYCGMEEMNYQGILYYFLDNEYYFKRERVYGEFDDAERFAFFSRAALESLIHIPGFKPDILHCHDWHTALIPLMLKAFYSREPLYYHLRTVFTIHNLKYQGVFPSEVLGDILGLGQEYFTGDTLEFFGAVNYMKAGLLYADRLTTVSPTYAQEIQNPYYGEHLDGVLRGRRDHLTGILNGIDYEPYDPAKDSHLVMSYDDHNLAAAKAENKKQLQKEFGLPSQGEPALLGMISRLVEQKGVDLLAHVLDEILNLRVQLVILGSGERPYEEMLRHVAARYPGQVALKLGFSDQLAHRIYAGADMLLMPSRFEPCGIAQMIAMRYGTVPIVRATGGLKDTVIPYQEGTGAGNGFRFANYNAHELLYTVQRAVRIYEQDKLSWERIRRQALQSDFSWEKSAKAYFGIYESLT